MAKPIAVGDFSVFNDCHMTITVDAELWEDVSIELKTPTSSQVIYIPMEWFEKVYDTIQEIKQNNLAQSREDK